MMQAQSKLLYVGLWATIVRWDAWESGGNCLLPPLSVKLSLPFWLSGAAPFKSVSHLIDSSSSR